MAGRAARGLDSALRFGRLGGASLLLDSGGDSGVTARRADHGLGDDFPSESKRGDGLFGLLSVPVQVLGEARVRGRVPSRDPGSARWHATLARVAPTLAHTARTCEVLGRGLTPVSDVDAIRSALSPSSAAERVEAEEGAKRR
jgi:hypothetical protein